MNNPDNDKELIELRVKLQAAEGRISDLEEDREHWRKQANMLLSSPASRHAEDSLPVREEAPGGFWERVFGG